MYTVDVAQCDMRKGINMEKDTLYEDYGKVIEAIKNNLEQVDEISMESLDKNNTVLIIVDMVNGFAKEGLLMSPRIESLIPKIVELSTMCDTYEIPQLAFADYHTEESVEFMSYVPHCKADTTECEIVEEIKALKNYKLINKNSTNGFLEDAFQKWFIEHKQITNYIIVGDCTDICVQQFALSVKAWFNKENIKSRVIIPKDAVDTYDFELHHGDVTHIMGLYNMQINGVEIVKAIK